MTRPLVVAVEGCDGTGKTTLCLAIMQALVALNIATLLIRRPLPGSIARHLIEDATSNPAKRHALKDGRLAKALDDDAQRALGMAASIDPRAVALLDRHWLSAVVEQGRTVEQQRAQHGEPDLWVICAADWRTVHDRLRTRTTKDAHLDDVGEIGRRLTLYEWHAERMQAPVLWVTTREVKQGGASRLLSTALTAADIVAGEIAALRGTI